MVSIKIVSFNIRCDYKQDGKNNFCHRKKYILEKIKKECPDVIGFQEVLPHVQQWLRENLTDYYIVGCGRDEHFQDEHITLALRKNTIELYALDFFWLSPNPDKPGSRYQDQSSCPRICINAIIKYQFFNEPIWVYNTHLDHEGSLSRKNSILQILEKIKQNQKIYSFPIIFMGDFNTEPDSQEMSVLRKYNQLNLKDTTKELGATFHNYGKEEEKSKIDYLLIDNKLKATNATLWIDCENEVYLSDHYPLAVDLVQSKECL